MGSSRGQGHRWGLAPPCGPATGGVRNVGGLTQREATGSRGERGEFPLVRPHVGAVGRGFIWGDGKRLGLQVMPNERSGRTGPWSTDAMCGR
jgi:hypothetical protein